MSNCPLMLKDRSKFRMKSFSLLALPLAFFVSAGSNSAEAATLATLQSLPRYDIGSLQYVGGFKFPSGTLGESDASYAEGQIALGSGGSTMYLVGNVNQQAIGEFKIPTLINSLSAKDFNTASVVQNFSRVLSRPETGNPQAMDRIGGMEYLNGQLVVNTYIYYDAPATATQTTLVIKDATKLSTSAVAGYHSFSPHAHASGWMSPIPTEWQAALGGTYIAGNSSGVPIISRLSVGPTAFVFDPTNPLLGNLSPSNISMSTLMDFSLDHAMGIGSQTFNDYMYNVSKTNTLWSHLSRASYGFIVPGTRTYMVVGYNGGMTSGIGYKATQENGYVCPGACAYLSTDYSNYYWLFDLNDMLKVKAGQLPAYQMLPYAYGKLNLPYAQNGYNEIIGADFDSSKGLLYLSLQSGDRLDYGWNPSVVAFKLTTAVSATASPPSAPSGLTVKVITTP